LNSIETLLSKPPFELSREQKTPLFEEAIFEAFNHHYNNNELFRNYCENNGFTACNKPDTISDYPYLPVNIFKNRRLTSVPDDNIKSILNSSATSGIPSTVVLDALTSKRQVAASAKVMADYLGNNRAPLFILDENPMKATKPEISARAAATRGFLILSTKSEYFLDDSDGQLSLNIHKFQESLKQYENSQEQIRIFGFTFLLYEKVVRVLLENNIKCQLPENSKIAHIGGWKKLESQKVSKEQFLSDICEVFGIDERNIFDFYGFTEQMGLVYVSAGSLPKTVPAYAEIIIRDFQSLDPVEDGEIGLIQILTPLPHSYPGISVLTEDVGRITGRGVDETGRNGTQFEIVGRAKKAEVRGCGDIMSELIA
jgi:phenylacetate-coenzyme A ligase PaaK-like adenylate-forming protein